MKPKKQALLHRLGSITESLRKPIIRIYRDNRRYHAVWNKLIHAVRILVASTRKFIIDDCFTKASSITYTIILSLVPALTVALTVYSSYYGAGENKKELFDRVLRLLAQYNIKVSVDPLFDALLGLVENAGKIGGISAALMIFSATAMLRSLEKSLNDVWKVKKARPIHLKIIYYWGALTLGPILLAAGMTAATLLSSMLSSPNYNAAFVTNAHQIWVVGNKSAILSSDAGKIGFRNAGVGNGTIDFDNQKIYRYEPSTRVFAEQEGRVEPMEIKKADFKDIQFIGDNGWIVGTGGIMLHTTNGGATWLIRKFENYSLNGIYMTDDTRGFIVSGNGVILTTRDGGASWRGVEWEGQPRFTAIAFHEKEGIITGARGIILQTRDGGDKWELKHVAAARQRSRYLNLNRAFFINPKQIWITGSEGLLLHSSDGGRTWSPKKFKEHDYYSACFLDSEEGFIGGSDGILIRTKNGGANWDDGRLPILRINALLFKDNRLWAVGDAGSIMASPDRGRTWQMIKKGRYLAYNVINFLAPFVFIWLLILPTYMTLPNIKVPFKPAAVGAAFTSTVWVIFILLFIVYIKGFAQGTFAIYGTLAAIPLFLLMVYASSLIILYGAEVAYSLMHPETYQSPLKAYQNRQEPNVYSGIALLRHIYRKFEGGDGASSLKELQKAIGGAADEIDLYIRLFTDEKLILKDSDSDYLPATNSGNVRINDIIDLAVNPNLGIPAGPEKSFTVFMKRLFNKISASRKKAVGDLTLKELIDKD